MLSTVLQDVTFAFRQFRRSPGFAATAVLTLALGVGTTTAIFSLVDGILLRPLPFPHADQLVAIETLEFPPGVAPTNVAAASRLGSSYPNFFDWQRQSHTFESLASYDISSASSARRMVKALEFWKVAASPRTCFRCSA